MSAASLPTDPPGEEATARDLRWNFVAAMIDAAGWGVGMGLVSATTILPSFVNHLSGSPQAVGLIQSVMLFGWLLPGILVSGWVERLPRVKHSIMWVAAIERAMLLVMAPLSVWLGPRDRPALLLAFFTCWAVMNFCIGANTPGYYKLIAKTIPPELRGRLYGIGGAVSGLLGMAAAYPAAWFMGEWGFPNGYAACFLVAFVVQSLSVAPLGFMREPAQPVEAGPPPERPWKALRLAREDSRLRWICAAVALFSVNQMAGAFYTLYAVDRFQAVDATIAGFTAVQMGAKTGGYLLVGWLGDRFGNRAAVRLASVCGTLAAVAALGAPDLRWLALVFALNEIAAQGWGVCAMNYVLELCPPERAGTYTAVYGVLTGPFRVGLPLVGGILVERLGFSPVFIAAIVGGLLALGLLARLVPEPRDAAVSG